MKKLIAMAAAAAVLASFSACRTCCGWGPGLPNLKGEWDVVSYSHHHAKHGYLDVSDPDAKWVITEQQGKHFHGERTILRKVIDGKPQEGLSGVISKAIDGKDGKPIKEGFSGVISADNTRVYIIDHEEDIVVGDLVADDEMVLYILGKTYKDREPRAGYVVLHKIK